MSQRLQVLVCTGVRAPGAAGRGRSGAGPGGLEGGAQGCEPSGWLPAGPQSPTQPAQLQHWGDDLGTGRPDTCLCVGGLLASMWSPHEVLLGPTYIHCVQRGPGCRPGGGQWGRGVGGLC